MEAIHGMPAEDARTLDALALEACALLDGVDPLRILSAFKEVTLHVGTAWSDTGTALEYRTPGELFPDGDAWTEALIARTRGARTVAAGVIAVIDRPAAAEIFRKAALLQVEGSLQVSYEAGLVRAFWSRWQDLLAALPPEFPGKLFLAGRFRLDALTAKQIAAIPIRELAAVVDRLDSSDVKRLLGCHPELETVEQRLALLSMVIGPSRERREVAQVVLWSLVMERPVEASAWVERLFELDDRDDPHLVSLAIAADCRPALERLWNELPARRAQTRLVWDPQHTDLVLDGSIRAGLALDPERASSRFAPFFAVEAVSNDEGAKLAHDIWMLGMGEQVRHGATRSATLEGDLLARDAGWFPLAARHAHHPRLGEMAMSILRRLPRPKRDALIAVHAGEASEPAAKPTRAKSTSTKRPPKKTKPPRKASPARKPSPAK